MPPKRSVSLKYGSHQVFFDIMTHLVIHFMEEVDICWPVQLRWCYLVECYLDVPTKNVQDKSKPEACMASGYSVDESLGLCSKYFALFPHIRWHVWDWEEEQKIERAISIGKGTLKQLSDKDLEQIY